MKNITVVKNQEYIVEIIDNGIEGEGIAKIENFTISYIINYFIYLTVFLDFTKLSCADIISTSLYSF